MHSTVDRFRWFDGSLLMPGLKMQPFVCPRKKALHPRTLPRLADVKFQLRKFEQQTATPRPRYAERRERQLAEVSENSTKEGRKKEPNTSRTKGIVIQMSPTCFGRNTNGECFGPNRGRRSHPSFQCRIIHSQMGKPESSGVLPSQCVLPFTA